MDIIRDLPWWVTALLGIVLITILLVVLRTLLWRLFGFDRIIHQKKSSEVRVGKIVETLAPILDSFPVEVGKPGTSLIFIGQPVDYIFFDPEEGVTFIEVKSGKAALSSTQKKIRAAIERKEIHWKEYRVD